jgi:hypothetical protein
VGSGVLVDRGVSVGWGVSVGNGVSVGKSVLVDMGVSVELGVSVGKSVLVDMGVSVELGVSVGAGVSVGVSVTCSCVGVVSGASVIRRKGALVSVAVSRTENTGAGCDPAGEVKARMPTMLTVQRAATTRAILRTTRQNCVSSTVYLSVLSFPA